MRPKGRRVKLIYNTMGPSPSPAMACTLLGTAASQYSCSIPLTCNGLHSVVGLLGTAASQYSCSTREPASGCLAAKSRRRLRSALGGGGSSQAGQCGGFRSS